MARPPVQPSAAGRGGTRVPHVHAAMRRACRSGYHEACPPPRPPSVAAAWHRSTSTSVCSGWCEPAGPTRECARSGAAEEEFLRLLSVGSVESIAGGQALLEFGGDDGACRRRAPIRLLLAGCFIQQACGRFRDSLECSTARRKRGGRRCGCATATQMNGGQGAVGDQLAQLRSADPQASNGFRHLEQQELP